MKVNLLKKITKLLIILIILTFTIKVNAAFTEPTTAPSSSDQDFPQNILGANNNNNDFDSTNVTANNDGSLIERLEYIITSLSSLWTKVGNLLYYNTGNVGIGTSTPSALLEVSGDGQSALKVTDVTNSITTGIWSGTTQGSIGTLTNTDLRFLTNGTSKMTIDTSGNVGVGTTGPNELLEVKGSSPSILLRDNKNGAWNKGDIIGELGFSDSDTSGSGPYTVAKIQAIDTASLDNTGPRVGLSFFTTVTYHDDLQEVMRIQHDGNVGIGTTAPNAKLEVYDLGNIAETTVIAGYSPEASAGLGTYGAQLVAIQAQNNANAHGAIFSSKHADSYSLLVGRHDTAYNSFVVKGNGNVGIGTTGPVTKLDITGQGTTGTVTPLLTLSANGSAVSDGAQINFAYNKTSSAILNASIYAKSVSGGGGSLTLATAASDGATPAAALTILKNGNVGIGTTGPQRKLDVLSSAGNPVSGVARIMSTSEYGLEFGGFNQTPWGMWMQSGYYVSGGGTYTSAGPLAINPNGGNVGIGTTAPLRKLQIEDGSYGGNFTDGSATGDLIISGNARSGINILTPNTSQGYLSFGDPETFLQAYIEYNHNGGANTMKFQNSGNFIFTTGNVGIGTTEPAQKLHIAGTGTTRIDISNTGGATRQSLYSAFDDNNNFGIVEVYDYNASAGLPLLLNPNGGNVGIGTTAPIAKLDVSGPSSGGRVVKLGPYYVMHSYNGTVSSTSGSCTIRIEPNKSGYKRVIAKITMIGGRGGNSTPEIYLERNVAFRQYIGEDTWSEIRDQDDITNYVSHGVIGDFAIVTTDAAEMSYTLNVGGNPMTSLYVLVELRGDAQDYDVTVTYI